MTFREIPVPIPNTEVKPKCAENTCGLPCWEDRLSLVFLFCKIGKLIDEKVANSVKLVTSQVDDNTEQGESYV